MRKYNNQNDLTLAIISIISLIGYMIYRLIIVPHMKRIPSKSPFVNSLTDLNTSNIVKIGIDENDIYYTKINTKYKATIDYTFHKIHYSEYSYFFKHNEQKTQYLPKKFNVIIYSNGKQIAQYDVDYYERIYFSYQTEDIVSSIDNFVKAALNDIHEVCMNHNRYTINSFIDIEMIQKDV